MLIIHYVGQADIEKCRCARGQICTVGLNCPFNCKGRSRCIKLNPFLRTLAENLPELIRRGDHATRLNKHAPPRLVVFRANKRGFGSCLVEAEPDDGRRDWEGLG